MIRVLLFICLYAISQTISAQKTKDLETYFNNEGIVLEGTLTYTGEKQPLVIWVAGSGNVDRNGNQYPIVKANYVKQLRDELTKNNIAFFSYDKRTANRKNLKKLENVVFEDFVSDLKAHIKSFKHDYYFNEIILIGHSQGSLTAMLACENADKFISLAGAGESIDKIIAQQIEKQSPPLAKTTKEYFEELQKTDTIKKVNPFLMSVFAPRNQKFLKSWMQYNPAKEIQKIDIPILIINGTKDLQAPVSNAKKLQENNQKSKIVIIENMNHVLKDIKNDQDNQNSYLSAKYPISKELIKVIKNFILSPKQD